MPPITSFNMQLQCPHADGSNAQMQVLHLGEFDDNRNPLNNPITVPVNSQPALVSVVVGTWNAAAQTFTADPTGKDVKFQTIAPKPANLTTPMTVKLQDGQTNPDGTPMQVVVSITLTAAPAAPSFEIVGFEPVQSL